MERTPLGLTKIDPGESPWEDGGSFFGRNQDITDHLLRLGAITHRHDAHAALANPATAPTVAPSNGGGQLDSGVDVFVVFTALDADGGETLPSPVTQVTTPGGLVAPAPPTGAPDYTAGDLPANTYYYALTATDGVGGETIPSDPLLVVVAAGNAHGQVILAGLQDAATAVGGTGWRLYRSVNGGPYGFLAAGSLNAFTDDCSHCADTQLPPPDDTGQAAGGSAKVTVTVPAAALPAGTVRYRIYAAADATFPTPSLLGDYAAADAGTAHDVTNFALLAGQPPVVSTAVGGLPKVKATTDIDWTGYSGSGGGGGGGGTGGDYNDLLPFALRKSESTEDIPANGVIFKYAGAPDVAVWATLESGQDTYSREVYGGGAEYVAAEWTGDTTHFTTNGDGNLAITDAGDYRIVVAQDGTTGNWIEASQGGYLEFDYAIGSDDWTSFGLDLESITVHPGGVRFIIDRAAGTMALVNLADGSTIASLGAADGYTPPPIGTNGYLLLGIYRNRVVAQDVRDEGGAGYVTGTRFLDVQLADTIAPSANQTLGAAHISAADPAGVVSTYWAMARDWYYRTIKVGHFFDGSSPPAMTQEATLWSENVAGSLTQPSGWTDTAPAGAWTNVAGHPALGYRLEQGGTSVRLRGVVSGGAAGSAIGVLDSDAHPNAAVTLPVTCLVAGAPEACAIVVGNDGTITHVGTAGEVHVNVTFPTS